MWALVAEHFLLLFLHSSTHTHTPALPMIWFPNLAFTFAGFFLFSDAKVFAFSLKVCSFLQNFFVPVFAYGNCNMYTQWRTLIRMNVLRDFLIVWNAFVRTQLKKSKKWLHMSISLISSTTERRKESSKSWSNQCQTKTRTKRFDHHHQKRQQQQHTRTCIHKLRWQFLYARYASVYVNWCRIQSQ